MRGARNELYTANDANGIIPADAGSTLKSPSVVITRTDHPRRCGEHDNLDSDMEGPEGSSPQMRGALFRIRLINF